MESLKVINDGLQIHIDYLSFTFPLEPLPGETIYDAFKKLMPEIATYFYMEEDDFGEILNYAHNGYDYELSLGQHIRVRFGGKATKMRAYLDFEDLTNRSIETYETCNIELKGQACREIEFKSLGTVNYIDIIEWYSCKLHGHTTRIDIAIDDMTGDIITLDKVLWYVKRGYYSSSFRSAPEMFKSVGIDSNGGTSLYFGRSNGKHKNDLELCCYNKAAERRFNNDSYTLDYWTRYELRYRNDKADAVSYFMFKINLEDIGEFACGELHKALDLKQKTINGKATDNVLIRRWDTLSAWDKFLNNIKGVKFSLRPKMENTIERKKAWRTYSLTAQNIMLELAQAYTSDDEWLDSSFAQIHSNLKDQLNWFDEHQFTKKDIETINNYIREQRCNGVYLRFIDESDIEIYRNNLARRIENLEKNYILPF